MIGKLNYQELGVEAELNFEFLEFYHYIFHKRYGHRNNRYVMLHWSTSLLTY